MAGLSVSVTSGGFSADPAASPQHNQEQFQAAIEYVGARGGGEVLVEPGMFRLAPHPEDGSYALRINYSNVTLRGRGSASHLETADVRPRGGFPDAVTPLLISSPTDGYVSRVQVRDLYLSTAAPVPHSGTGTEGAPGIVSVNGMTRDVEISGCWLASRHRSGVTHDGHSVGLRITHNRFLRVGRDGIYIAGYSVEPVIDGNVFDGVDPEVPAAYILTTGISLKNTFGATISRNRISRFRFAAVNAGDFPSVGLVVSHNVVNQAGQLKAEGIMANNLVDATIEHNAILQVDQNAIGIYANLPVNGVRIRYNYINQTEVGNGILVQAGVAVGRLPLNIEISNNALVECRQGIKTDRASGNVVIADNSIFKALPDANRAISTLTPGSLTVVERNVVHGYGDPIYAPAPAIARDNVIA
jgi:hypothetical protein